MSSDTVLGSLGLEFLEAKGLLEWVDRVKDQSYRRW